MKRYEGVGGCQIYGQKALRNTWMAPYFNGSPTGHCLTSVESGAPNHDGLIGRTDTATVGGGGVRVRECNIR